MKVLKIITSIVAILALVYYGWRMFGNPYGKKYVFSDKHTVYYKGDGVTETNARDLSAYLKEQDYFSDETASSVQITKTEATKDTINLKFVVDKAKITTSIENAFLLIGAMMPKTVFNGAPVNVILTDESLDEIKNLGYAKAPETNEMPAAEVQQDAARSETDPAAQLAPRVKEIIPGNNICYSDASASRLNDMSAYLSAEDFFKAGRKVSIVFDKNQEGYFLMLPFGENYLNDQPFLEEVKKMGEDIQTKLFPDDRFTMYACDLNFKPAFSYISGSK